MVERVARQDILPLVRVALAEDVGSGDLTADLIPAAATGNARVVAREPAVLCGREWFEAVFNELDPGIVCEWQCADGDPLVAQQTLCELQGNYRAMLTGERAALNLLQTLSGTATAARQYADAVAGTGTRVLDTRKTLPGLRLAQKYAVRCGGAHNHRVGLYDAILIKENHIHASGSISAAVAAAHQLHAGMPVQVEVENLDELAQALTAAADAILLDNFSVTDLRTAVELTASRARLEASGGVTLDNIRSLAETGVDCISVGALTKDVRAVDLSMRFVAGHMMA